MKNKIIFSLILLLLILQLPSCAIGNRDVSDSSLNGEDNYSSASSEITRIDLPGYDVDFVIKDNGKVYGRGYNYRYVLGIEDKNYIDNWVEIPIAEKVIKVCCVGPSRALFLTENGKIYYTGTKNITAVPFFDLEIEYSDEYLLKEPRLINLDAIDERIVDIEYSYDSSSVFFMMVSETGKAYFLQTLQEVVEFEFPDKIVSTQLGVGEFWFLSENGNLYSIERSYESKDINSEKIMPELRAKNVVYYNADVRTIHYIDDKGELYGAGFNDEVFGFIPENLIDRDFPYPVKWQHDFQKVELPEKVKFTFKWTDGFMCAVGVSGKVYVCERPNVNYFTEKEEIEDERLMTYSGWNIKNIDDIEELWFNDSNILKIKRKNSDWEYCYIFNPPEGRECFEFYSINEIYK